MAIEVQAPNGDIVEFPNGTSPATIKQVMAAKYGGPKGKAKAKPAPKAEDDTNIINALGAGILRAPVEAISAGYSGVANLLDLFGQNQMAANVRAEREAGRKRAFSKIEQQTKGHPISSEIGKLTGDLIITAPVLGGAASLLSKAAPVITSVAPRAGKFIAETARVIPAGGFGAKTRAARLAGGAIAGATTAAVTNQDIGTGASVGAAIPVVGNMLGKTFGAGYDVVAKRVGKIKAAQMLRKAIGDNIDAVKAALSQASSNERGALLDFLESKGIRIPQLAALEKNVRQSPSNAPLRASAQAMEKELAELRKQARRGGATATQAEQIVAQRRKELMEATQPLREAGLEAADLGRTQVLPLENQAAQQTAQANAMTASGLVPRMRGLQERAAGQAELMADNPAIFPDMGLIQQTRGVSGAAGQRADDAIELQTALRDAARESEQQAARLRAQGNKPIDVNPLLSKLRGDAAEAQYVNPDRFAILSDFANRIEARAQQMGGVIDANGLYEVRKNLNQSIEKLLAGRDPSSIQKATSSILGEVRPQIDAAFRAAGGDELLQSIDVVAKGLDDLEQQTVANALTRLQQRRPDTFIRIMGGEEPGAVRILTQGKTGDINQALGARFADVQKLATPTGNIAERNKLYIPDELPFAADYRKGIASEVGDIMQAGVPMIVRAPLRLAEAKIPGGGRAGAVLEGRYGDYIQNKILSELSPMLATPQNAMAALNIKPTSEVMANYLQNLSPEARNAFARSLLTGGLYGTQPNY